MHRIVLDINVVVSSLITDGKARQLWLKAVRKELNVVLSSKIRSEFLAVIARKKFQHYLTEMDIVDFIKALDNTARFVRPAPRVKAIKEDPDDNLIIATAIAGRADYIVSGDKHLLELGEFRGIKIVTVDKMLDILEH